MIHDIIKKHEYDTSHYNTAHSQVNDMLRSGIGKRYGE